MTPGLGFFYSGMARSKNALHLIMACYLAIAIVTIQWVLFGFSLAFSESSGPFIGNFAFGGMTGVGANALAVAAPSVPAVAFALYQLQFATITVALIFGSVAERIRLLPAMFFIFFWTSLIYDPVAYWTWGAHGWIRNMACLNLTSPSSAPCGYGSYDYAGGGPVHVASGFSGLAFAIFLGKRKNIENIKPHNILNVFLGTALLWFGWFGFNGGSAISATPRAAMAAFVTTVAACAGAMSWLLYDFVNNRKLSGLGFCSGAVAALVGITPSSGFVAPWAALVIGAVSGVVCNLSCHIKVKFGFDDSLDAWGVHGVGGFVGNIMTGVFAQAWIATLDGTSIPGGWMDGNWIQVGYQLAGSSAIAAYSFVGTYLILYLLDLIPGLDFRPTEEEEKKGGDIACMGETAYQILEAVGIDPSLPGPFNNVTLIPRSVVPITEEDEDEDPTVILPSSRRTSVMAESISTTRLPQAVPEAADSMSLNRHVSVYAVYNRGKATYTRG
ncbi:ammonium transporter AmtB-like domain-containing protein [Polychytrium aggregatum]|uniref:ammonium transporter AmtB-like domain-containing protein n=1 Tax=Polychytrium aggregatum TaxID=110093 RepID=UPI0022FF3B80|nr:ammonium transporter AmtB-like domain-containing protein [Polychytrium aggregatum]KAI9203346.1 ammonium transporter AmtB-like domain-containing protein [Polychytrium aggregatum]